MTLEFNNTDYVILLNGLYARAEKVEKLIEIFSRDNDTPTSAQHYKEELADIQSVQEKLRKAFSQSIPVL